MLIGAHSYGQFHAGNSMFKYSWTRDQTKYLNNQVIQRPDTQKHADDTDIDAYFLELVLILRRYYAFLC